MGRDVPNRPCAQAVTSVPTQPDAEEPATDHRGSDLSQLHSGTRAKGGLELLSVISSCRTRPGAHT